MLRALAGEARAVPVSELALRLGIDQSPVAGAVSVLADLGFVVVDEATSEEFRRGAKAKAFADGVFPERIVARALARAGGRAGIRELPEAGGVEAKLVGESLRWLSSRGWAAKEGQTLVLAEGWIAPEPPLQHDEALLAALPETGGLARAELEARGLDVQGALAALEGRAGIAEVRERTTRLARATDAGRAAVERGLDTKDEVTELTTELLVSGRWRETTFRAYDVALAGPRVLAGKEHPFRQILEATRRVFLEMGFEETASPWVESGFWDFDALFQPQDHPARDMQDTFYVRRPERATLPDESLVHRVGRTHEDGGDTGSVGWRTRWDRSLASCTVLRTHTTASTIRALAAHPNPPRKVFCVGPVFRRETIDYKHLPVFHQVDGIVIDEDASFAALLGLLGTFYRKMGFPRFQFRPAFFPYTEPSVEIFVWMESRRDWVEMGGAGVFRPEVTEPLAAATPFSPGGWGLERLAMFQLGLKDIREIYLAHLDWLEEVALCRW
ncbi:MAG: phenylalanine--tRNA ligase subunit alpha [Acidobacteria bacterium]|nr:phenylalanine--tRNA ligase subunit alpha [Acidobacteriota bacterium]